MIFLYLSSFHSHTRLKITHQKSVIICTTYVCMVFVALEQTFLLGIQESVNDEQYRKGTKQFDAVH